MKGMTRKSMACVALTMFTARPKTPAGPECGSNALGMALTRILLAVVLGMLPVAAGAALTVDDRWAQGGETVVTGAGWRALFTKDDRGVVLTSGDVSLRIEPFGHAGDTARLAAVQDVEVQDAAGLAILRAEFTAASGSIACAFRFTEAGTLCVMPGEGVRGVYLRCPMAVGMMPGKQLEDVLYLPGAFEGLNEVFVPAENYFAGLLEGHGGILACAWPKGASVLSLLRGDKRQGSSFEAVKLMLAGQDLYLELLTAPAIWHYEKLERNYLERDVALGWRRPFPAGYKTQLVLRGQSATPRTFVFRKKPFTQYLPEAGEVAWPVWFEGEKAFMRLSKKLPPRGEAIIYPFEEGAKTLMGFVERTPVAGLIAARNKPALLPHGPRNAQNVGFVACGGTGVMRRTIFEVGVQQREKAFLTEYADFLADYVAIVQQRHIAFFRFIRDTRAQLETWLQECGGDAAVRAYLEAMIAQANDSEEELQREMDLFGYNTPEDHIAHAGRAADRLKELVNTPGTELFPESDELIHLCNRLAWGHAESGGMRFSMLTRAWAQEAASACAGTPAVLGYARAIRAAARKALNGAPAW